MGFTVFFGIVTFYFSSAFLEIFVVGRTFVAYLRFHRFSHFVYVDPDESTFAAQNCYFLNEIRSLVSSVEHI